jgi:hypothetical protein
LPAAPEVAFCRFPGDASSRASQLLVAHLAAVPPDVMPPKAVQCQRGWLEVRLDGVGMPASMPER